MGLRKSLDELKEIPRSAELVGGQVSPRLKGSVDSMSSSNCGSFLTTQAYEGIQERTALRGEPQARDGREERTYG